METRKSILTKRDTRVFAPTPIPDAVLNDILQAGRMAGSAKAAEPVRIVVVREQAQKEALAKCGRFTPHMPSAAAVVCLVLVPEPDQPPDQWAYFRGPFDAGRAAQNVMLAAWDHGISSCPVTLHDADAARDVLGLPAGYYVINTITLGYPGGADPTTGTRPRQPLDEYVRFERWS